MDNTIEKRIQSLNDRLSYTRDIFAGKHEDSIRLLDEKLTEFTNRVRNGEVEDPHTEIVSLEDLFVFVEKRLEKLITPMDRVRIVRHPQRICLRDILENVYDNFTEVGGQDEHSLDPSMLIARAVITRRRGKKMHTQSVMVIGQEKGHGAEFRNGGSVKPWGNAKALQYMRVAETEGIPIHCYIFTPGSYPIEDYPGAAQQIARNIYTMAGLRVPVISIISEGTLIVVGLIGMGIVAAIVGRILRISPYLGFANCLTALYGFPFDAIMTEKICNDEGATKDEVDYLMSRLFPSMIVGGFITVTITSVLLAGFFVKLL